MDAAVADAVARLVGVPYRLFGRDPATGWDCLGCAIWVRQHLFGRPTPTADAVYTAQDAAAPDVVAGMIRDRLGLWRPLGAASRAPGSVLLLRTPLVAGHVGVVLDAQNFIHCHQGSGTAVADMRRWAHRVEETYECAG